MFILIISLPPVYRLDDLKKKGFLACGTTQKGRLGYPLQFKGTDAAWNKVSKRGDEVVQGWG